METRVAPPASHLDLLERPIFAAFATVAADGSPRVNPMWFLWDGEAGAVRLTHTRTRHNFRFLQRDARVALAFIDPDDQYRYLSLWGAVESFEDDPTGAFYQRLQERYRGFTSEVKDRDVRVVLAIRPLGWKARPR
jgi:PPOX class probable F420-dependent enzyme